MYNWFLRIRRTKTRLVVLGKTGVALFRYLGQSFVPYLIIFKLCMSHQILTSCKIVPAEVITTRYSRKLEFPMSIRYYRVIVREGFRAIESAQILYWWPVGVPIYYKVLHQRTPRTVFVCAKFHHVSNVCLHELDVLKSRCFRFQ